MKELKYLNKQGEPVSKTPSKVSHPPKMAQLHAMSTEELVKMLMNPELARSMNIALRQQIVKILQEREGNAFVQRLLGTTSERTSR